MHVVFGASGRVGGGIARNLIQQGEPVRVVLRNAEQGDSWKDLGAQVAIANVYDVDAIAAALDGASSAFLFNPPPFAGDLFAQAEEAGTALAMGARRAKLPKAVVLTSVGAQHASGTGAIATMYRFEALLDEVAPATLFLRPGLFLEDFGSAVETVTTEGVLPTFLEPSRKVAMVSAVDIARIAVQFLCENWTGTRVVELEAPDDYSAADVAAAYAKATGRPVTAAVIPFDQRANTLAATGASLEVVNASVAMYDWINSAPVMHEPGRELRRGTVTLTDIIEQIVSEADGPRKINPW